MALRAASSVRACGLGVDLLDLGRARRFVASHDAQAMERFLSPSEFALWRSSRDPVRAFALIFCAKEAASKAAGVSLRSPGDFRSWRVGWNRGGLTMRRFGARLRTRPIRYALGAFRITDHIGVLCVAYHTDKG